LLQPDENEPSRLLGTCEPCRKWYFLMELKAEWKKTLLVELPSGDTVPGPLHAAKSPLAGTARRRLRASGRRPASS
jgi:hypothetical protein